MVALAGACIGFLPHNFYPAKIFMGDTGSTFLGFILGAISIQGLFKMYAVISFFVPFLIIGLPIFDTLAAIIRRLARGQNPMHADRGHVHHKLIDMGFSQKQAVAILYAITVLLGLIAVVFTTRGVIRAIIIIIAVCAAIVIALEVSKVNAHNHERKVEAVNADPAAQPEVQEHCEGKSE
jgi:UDP-GlcNAc:undecaprenyl-phosphate GlcNAc-1-phosphate transferase